MQSYDLQIGRARPFIESASENDWETIDCARNPGHQRAGRRVTDLFLDILSWNVVDFSRTMLSDIVITDNALHVLRDAKLDGFKVKPKKTVGAPASRNRSDFPQLWEFVVTGSGGPAHSSSGIVELSTCEACGLVRHSAFENGINVDEATYDGSDFFTVLEYPKYVLASERAKLAIEEARLTNISFLESSALKWPDGVLKPRSLPL